MVSLGEVVQLLSGASIDISKILVSQVTAFVLLSFRLKNNILAIWPSWQHPNNIPPILPNKVIAFLQDGCDMNYNIVETLWTAVKDIVRKEDKRGKEMFIPEGSWLLPAKENHILKMSSRSSFMSTVPELTGPNYTVFASMSKSWLQSQGIAYVLKTPRPGHIEIVSTTPPPAAPAGTTAGATTSAAASEAGSEIQVPPPNTRFIAADDGSTADWDRDNDKAMGVIKLHVTQAIGAKLEDIETAKEMWNTLKTLYGKPGAAEIFQNFKRAMNIESPGSAHPGAAIDLIKMYLTRINNAGEKTQIPMYLQYMIVINKLPADIYSYNISQETKDDVDAFETGSLDTLRTTVVNAWETRGRKKSQSKSWPSNKKADLLSSRNNSSSSAVMAAAALGEAKAAVVATGEAAENTPVNKHARSNKPRVWVLLN
ncbi:hypothetical protein D9758_005269 [Tetrapyrgos nigripes]|uniref:Uncharacterized protein n=1 Tax=Tetrapyrgos nigripes TaxID=182062 RepID=A0A8H5LWV2_9AGAR|nr:hypothetical protein D9758_005269 [Tetrapyrgos nigripes]